MTLDTKDLGTVVVYSIYIYDISKSWNQKSQKDRKLQETKRASSALGGLC